MCVSCRWLSLKVMTKTAEHHNRCMQSAWMLSGRGHTLLLWVAETGITAYMLHGVQRCAGSHSHDGLTHCVMHMLRYGTAANQEY